MKRRIMAILLALSLILIQIPATLTYAEEVGEEEKGVNYLANPGFESDIWGEDYGWDKTVDNWGSDGNVTLSWSGKDNALSGEHCVNYWSAIENRMIFSQKVTLPAGNYEFGASVMGEKSQVTFYCNVSADSEEMETQGWNVWRYGYTNFSLTEETEVIVGISIAIQADGWGYLDDCYLGEAEGHVDPEPEEPEDYKEVSIEPIEGLSKDFMRGVDISSLLSLENAGVSYYNKNGIRQDLFDILQDAGVNWIRVRIWNDPYDAEGHAYGGGNNDLAAALELGRRTKEHNMHLFLDFHYSDFWASPQCQNAPKAWKNYSVEQMENAIYNFTKDSLNAFKEEGIPVDMVQIGNETSDGVCGTYNNWSVICRYLQAGCKAVKEYNPSIKRMIHFDKGAKGPKIYYKSLEELEKYGVDYDVLGLSWYGFYDHGYYDDLLTCMNYVAKKYGKEIVIAENSYAVTFDDSDGHPDIFGDDRYFDSEFHEKLKAWEISPQGQAQQIRDIIKAVSDVEDGKGIGYFYWEPAWITVGDTTGLTGEAWQERFEENQKLWNEYGCGWATEYAKEYQADAALYWGGSSWGNQALFKPNGHPYDSLYVFNYIYDGNETENNSTVSNYVVPNVVLNISSNLTEDDLWKELWKDKVNCTLSDGNTEEIPVLRWVQTNCDHVIAAYKGKAAGDYTIPGILNDEHHTPVSMKVKIIGDLSSVRPITLEKTAYTYDGTVKTPAVAVLTHSGKKLVKDTDYTVKYASGRKAIGSYAVTVTGKGLYNFTKVLTFKVNPKTTSVKRLTAGRSQMTVWIKKQASQTTGYQIQYSTSKKFPSSSATKLVKIKSNKTTKKLVKGLKKGKRYYVRVRTFKKLKDKIYYSNWSKDKNVVVK